MFGVRPAATRRSLPSITRSPSGVAQPEAHPLARAALDGAGLGAEDHIDAVLREDRADRLGDVGVLAGQELRPALDHGDLAAEAPEGLRQLDADIAAAEHDQVRGQPVELERLDMGQRRGRGQARDVRNGRVRAEIEEDALAFEPPRPALGQAHLDRPGRDEAALAQDELEPVRRELRSGGSRPCPSTISRLRCAHALHVRGRPARSAGRRLPRGATRSATLALRITFLLGRQAMLGHEPPISARSTTTVGRPFPASSQAMYLPASPPPRTTFSICSASFTIVTSVLGN